MYVDITNVFETFCIAEAAIVGERVLFDCDGILLRMLLVYSHIKNKCKCKNAMQVIPFLVLGFAWGYILYTVFYRKPSVGTNIRQKYSRK